MKMEGKTVSPRHFEFQELWTETMRLRDHVEKLLRLRPMFEDAENWFRFSDLEIIDSIQIDDDVTLLAEHTPCDDDPSPTTLCNVVERPQLFDQLRLEKKSSEFACGSAHFNAMHFPA
jgi:hypothetical protein